MVDLIIGKSEYPLINKSVDLLKKLPVDIIMPNYNKGKYLVKAIKSVLNQSFRNWKLYIIDDASNDDSVKILKKFKKIKK